MALDFLSHRFLSAFGGRLKSERADLAAKAASLDALSPLKVLSRGYAVARGPSGRVLTSAADAKPGDSVRLTLSKGELECRITEVKE
jgi:exodeoxyribonuclease VII large subunit